MISTHAPLAGRDFWGRLHRGCLTNFNPRAPCGARPAPHFGGVFSKKFQPTRPLRGATNLSCGLCGKNKNFNPRAPCGARPTPTRSQCCRNGNFNPRAPCGARQNGLQIYQSWGRFQPTRPLRGATEHRVDHLVRQLDFNPRAPCGARPVSLWNIAPREDKFQPTRPLRGATASSVLSSCVDTDFNPRAPCGARRGVFSQRLTTARFQPTRPLRGATVIPCSISMTLKFQPTRPLRGATVKPEKRRRVIDNFNPRAPCGARPGQPQT